MGRLPYPELSVQAGPGSQAEDRFRRDGALVRHRRGRRPVFCEGYCLANDLDQSTGRCYRANYSHVRASPLLARGARVGVNRIDFTSTGASITAVANDYAGAAGANPTISVFDELWAFTLERSRRLWDEMVPPPTRKVSARLTVTYAGFENESELLEEPSTNEGKAEGKSALTCSRQTTDCFAIGQTNCARRGKPKSGASRCAHRCARISSCEIIENG